MAALASQTPDGRITGDDLVELVNLAGITLDEDWFDGEYEDHGLDEEGFPEGGGPLDPAVDLDRNCFEDIVDNTGGHHLSNDDLMQLLRLLPMSRLPPRRRPVDAAAASSSTAETAVQAAGLRIVGEWHGGQHRR